MKSKELIRQLQEADPTGEVEVGVGNHDIFSVEPMPAYYDGKFQKLLRDESKKPYFDIVGAKWCSRGCKIKLVPMGVADVLWNNPKAVVDYSELGDYPHVEELRRTDDAVRKASRDVELKVEMDAFHRWVQRRPRPSGPARSAARRPTGSTGGT